MSWGDAAADAAFEEIAGLLATAFERYAKVQRFGPDPAGATVNRDLLSTSDQRVHVNGS